MTVWQGRRALSVAGLVLAPVALWLDSRVLVWVVVALLASAVVLRVVGGWRQVDPP